MEDLPEDLDGLQKMHGHLGPYVVVGLRMGAVAHRELGHYKGLTAEVTAVLTPPMRCVVDGVQYASQCTLGKGNIALLDGDAPSAVFRKGERTITIRLRPGLREKIDREMAKEKEKELEHSLYYFELPEDELLEVTETLVSSG